MLCVHGLSLFGSLVEGKVRGELVGNASCACKSLAIWYVSWAGLFSLDIWIGSELFIWIRKTLAILCMPDRSIWCVLHLCRLLVWGRYPRRSEPCASEVSQELSIHFNNSIISKVVIGDEEVTDSVTSFKRLNQIGHEYGIGRVDIAEDRFISLTPGLTSIYVIRPALLLVKHYGKILTVSGCPSGAYRSRGTRYGFPCPWAQGSIRELFLRENPLQWLLLEPWARLCTWQMICLLDTR